MHPHLCHRLNFNTPLAVFQLCNGHTRLCKLTLVALKELSVSHVRESGLKSIFVFQVASKAGVLSEFVFRTRRDEVRHVFPGMVWSDHYKLQLYDNANNARSKTEASRFKAKIKRRIET